MNILWKWLGVLLICISIFGCSRVSKENFDKIRTEMTMKEVIKILGEPTQSEGIKIGGVSGTSAIWKEKGSEIYIQFLNDKVLVKSFSRIRDGGTKKEVGILPQSP